MCLTRVGFLPRNAVGEGGLWDLSFVTLTVNCYVLAPRAMELLLPRALRFIFID